MAKSLILDCLGVAIAGREMPAAQISLTLIKENKGNASVWGHKVMVPALDAAFTNSVSANVLALDDFLFSFHPGQVNVPAAIAIGEEQGSSGLDLIEAVIAGYEVMGRVYLGGKQMSTKFRATSVFGPIGAAAVCGKLLKLNEDQLTNTLSFAANFSSGLTQCWLDGTMEGSFHAGLAIRNGIMAARLAKAGAVASQNTFEGKSGFFRAFAGTTEDVERSVNCLGQKFLIMETSYKKFPVCALQQIPISLVLRLVKKNKIETGSIKEIVERVSEWEAAFPGGDFVGPFENPGQTLLSAQFCAAAAFLNKPVNSYNFYIENFNNPEIYDLAKKVRLVGEKGRKKPLIEVTLKDGRRYHIEENAGEETLAPNEDRIIEKFKEMNGSLIGQQKADEIIDIVFSLERIDNISELTGKLRKFNDVD